MKKNTSILRTAFVLLLAAMSMLPARSQSQSYTWMTDINGDGTVNVADVTALIQIVLNGQSGVTINPNQSYLSARQFGAVGDGVTDDTEALERLFEAAFECKKAVFFDPGVYLIRRSLTLRTGMEVYGEDATITKKSAVTTTLSKAATQHQTSIEVASVEGFNVGDQFFICDDAGANYCTYGIITAIEDNRISFYNIFSDCQPDFPGCIRGYSRGSKVSTSFALLRSWSTRYECDGVYVHDLTLDGNRQSNEPRSWANSCLHIDSYYPGGYTGSLGVRYMNVQRNLIARNLTIKNSPHDAISDQGEGGLIMTECVVENCAMHGAHLGTVYANALISNNAMQGNTVEGSGVFFCQDVSNVIVDNNWISYFNHGCSDFEFGTCGKYITIRNNTFKAITYSVFDFEKATAAKRGGGLMITNNKIENLKWMIFNGDNLNDVIISNNEVTSVNKAPSSYITVTESDAVVIVGNTISTGASVANPVDVTNSTNVVENANSWN